MIGLRSVDSSSSSVLTGLCLVNILSPCPVSFCSIVAFSHRNSLGTQIILFHCSLLIGRIYFCAALGRSDTSMVGAEHLSAKDVLEASTQLPFH